MRTLAGNKNDNIMYELGSKKLSKIYMATHLKVMKGKLA